MNEKHAKHLQDIYTGTWIVECSEQFNHNDEAAKPSEQIFPANSPLDWSGKADGSGILISNSYLSNSDSTMHTRLMTEIAEPQFDEEGYDVVFKVALMIDNHPHAMSIGFILDERIFRFAYGDYDGTWPRPDSDVSSGVKPLMNHGKGHGKGG